MRVPHITPNRPLKAFCLAFKGSSLGLAWSNSHQGLSLACERASEKEREREKKKKEGEEREVGGGLDGEVVSEQQPNRSGKLISD